jgi:uncharacterized membrane protein
MTSKPTRPSGDPPAASPLPRRPAGPRTSRQTGRGSPGTSPAPQPAPGPAGREPPAPPLRSAGEHVQAIRDSEASLATFGYLSAIFLGPIVPLVIYLLLGRKSAFTRFHAATAVNLSLTAALYGISCLILGGLLLLDSITVALVIGLTLGSALWLTMLKYLIRGVVAASHSEDFEVPSWICARFLTPVTR